MVKSENFIIIKRLASQNVVCREGGSSVCAKWNNGYKLLIMVVAIVVVVVVIVSSDRSSYSDSGLLYNVRSSSSGHFLRFRAFLPIYLVFLFEN